MKRNIMDDELKQAAMIYAERMTAQLEEETEAAEAPSEEFEQAMQTLLAGETVRRKPAGHSPLVRFAARAAACLVLGTALFLGTNVTARAAVVSGISHLFDSAAWGWRQPETAAVLPADFAGIRTGNGRSGDFALTAAETEENGKTLQQIWLLDRAGRQIVGLSGGCEGWRMQLDFCSDPLQFARTESGFFVLDREALYFVYTPRLDLAGRIFVPDEGRVLRYSLPEGYQPASAAELRMVGGKLLLLDNAGGGQCFMLDGIETYRPGYGNLPVGSFRPLEAAYAAYARTVRQEDGRFSVETVSGKLEIELPEGHARLIRSEEDGRVLLLVRDLSEKESSEAHLTLREYAADGSLKKVSPLAGDAALWEEAVLFCGHDRCLVMAAAADMLCLYKVRVGEDCVRTPEAPKDLRKKERSILQGQACALGRVKDGENLIFTADPDADGLTELVRLTREGSLLTAEINGLPAGEFAADADAKLYLASADGRTAALVLESGSRICVYEAVKTMNVSRGQRIYFTARLLGEGRKLNELQPQKTAAEYLAAGWQVSPADGDVLDLNGDGSPEVLHLRGVLADAWPFDTEIAVREGSREGGYVILLGESAGSTPKAFDRLIYTADGDTICLTGLLTQGQETLSECFRLTAEEGQPLLRRKAPGTEN